MKLKIDPELRDLIPPLDPHELELLEQSLRAEGCRDKLVIWEETGKLIDGHNRYKFCSKYKIPFEVTKKSFPNIEAVKAWMEDNQLARRNLTDDQRKILIGKRYEREKASQGGSNKNKDLTTAEAIAIDSGVSPSSVRRFAKDARFYEKLKVSDPELAKKVWDGKVSLQDLKSKPLQEKPKPQVSLPFEIKFGDKIQAGDHTLLVGHPTDVDDVVNLLGSLPVTPPLMFIDNIEVPEKDIIKTVDLGDPDTLYLWNLNLILNDLSLTSIIIWLKTTYPKTDLHYTPRYETLYYHTSNKTEFRGPSQTNVWEIPNISEQKPIEVFLRPLRNHQGLIYQPYPKDPTLLLASNQLDRQSFIMSPNKDIITSLLQALLESDSSINIKKI